MQAEENRKADDDIFEICDFTVVTDMEHLIIALETSLIEWKLNGTSVQSPSADFFKQFPKDFLTTCIWKVSSQTFEHLERRFKLLYYKSTPDSDEEEVNLVDSSDCDASHQTKAAIAMSTPLADFVPSIISTQFGVLDFVVLSDADNDIALPEDDVLMILSAIQCATVNIECDVPILVQVGPMKNFLYNGVSQNRHVRTSFEGSFVRRPLYNHDNLSGLMGVLQEKVATSVSPLPKMFASIQFEYCLQEKLDTTFTNDFPDVSIDLKSLACLSNVLLPCGTSADPVREFRLAVRWPNQIESVMNENQAFTDLEPDYAPFWFASVDLNASIPCLLFEGLKGIVKLVSSESGSFHISDYIQSGDSQSSNTGASALSKLASEHSASYKFVPSGFAVESGSEEKMLAVEWVKKIFKANDRQDCTQLHSIDPDQLNELNANPAMSHSSGCPGSAVRSTPEGGHAKTNDEVDQIFCSLQNEVFKLISNAKNAPGGSFTERVCLSLCKALMTDNGLVLFAHLWTEIIKELRAFWENCGNLPGFLEEQVPDLASCLLHQKFQMLQCCIEARRRSHEMYEETRDFNSEVFFDALENVDSSTTVSDERTDFEPVGRSTIAEDLFCLHDSSKQLYVPVTQDRSPMTEDMLDEHTEFLSSLNDSEARMNAQISSLMSDMQAFKAANPGCCLSDFVRWHSPRDWIKEDDDDLGHLSERMSTEGNTWQNTWDDAPAIPVSLQKRLFNFSGDAEKILQRFENITVAELITMILPVAFSSSLLRLTDEAKCCSKLKGIGETLVKAAKTVRYFCTTNATTDDYLDLLRDMKSVELTIAYVKAVSSRFSNFIENNATMESCVREFASTLVEKFITKSSNNAQPPEENIRRQLVPIVGAPSSDLAVLVRKLMETDERVQRREERREEGIRKPRIDAKYPPPARKQYIIRWCTPRPGYNSRPVNHRLYVNIEKDEFRLCSSVTDDIVLM